MKRKPTMVIFDLDDTLYDYEPCETAGRDAIFRFAASELGVKASSFEAAYDVARLAVKKRLGDSASAHSRLLYCHEALEAIGLRSEPLIALAMEQEFWREYLLAMQLRPGIIELLQQLRFHDITIAIVTDLTMQIQFRKLAYLDVAQYIDHIVCSEETSGEKISLEPFRLMLSRVSAERKQSVWFVGDKDFDAPVEKLIAEGLIDDGWGFIRPSTELPLATSWRSASEIDKAIAEWFA
jgi:putative hydrolase of the HAD superfamily